MALSLEGGGQTTGQGMAIISHFRACVLVRVQHVLVHGCPKGCVTCNGPDQEQQPGKRTGQWIPSSVPVDNILETGKVLLLHDKHRNWMSVYPEVRARPRSVSLRSVSVLTNIQSPAMLSGWTLAVSRPHVVGL